MSQGIRCPVARTESCRLLCGWLEEHEELELDLMRFRFVVCRSPEEAAQALLPTWCPQTLQIFAPRPKVALHEVHSATAAPHWLQNLASSGMMLLQ